MSANSKVSAASVRDEQTLHDVLGVIHDLRQPVAAIRYAVDAARASAALPRDLQDVFDQLDRSAAWMSVMLQQPLDGLAGADGSRPGEPGSSRHGPTPHGDPVRVDLLATQVATTSATGGSCAVVVESGRAVSVAVTETELRRVLGNLLENAVRAAGPGGMVRVRVDADRTTAFLHVDDDGPGFGRVGCGSRLGLSMVAQVVLTAGGWLEIAGSDLGGARVTVALPACVPVTAGPRAPT